MLAGPAHHSRLTTPYLNQVPSFRFFVARLQSPHAFLALVPRAAFQTLLFTPAVPPLPILFGRPWAAWSPPRVLHPNASQLPFRGS